MVFLRLGIDITHLNENFHLSSEELTSSPAGWKGLVTLKQTNKQKIGEGILRHDILKGHHDTSEGGLQNDCIF